jgi:hypothetical protein
VTYLPIILLSIVIFTILGSCREEEASRLRIIVGFLLFGLCMFLAPVVACTFRSLRALLLVVAICGVADAAAQGALFGLAGASRQKKENTQALASGTSLSGAVISALRLLTVWLFLDETVSLYVYFMAIGIVCLASTWIYQNLVPYSANSEVSHIVPSNPSFAPALPPLEVESSFIDTRDTLLSIMSKSKGGYLCMLLTYWVTMTIFPGVLQEDLKVSQLTRAWCLLSFNIADVVGKFLEPLPITSSSVMLIAAMSRVLFIPLYMAFMNSTFVVFVLTLMLGLSNGLWTTTCMLYSLSQVEDKDKYVCGNISVVFLIVGLNLGAISSWIWVLNY